MEGGGFSLSVTPDTVATSGFFNLMGPMLEELPSNTIKGLFLLWSLMELQINQGIQRLHQTV